MTKFPHVLASFYGTVWAILPDKFREIEAALWRRIENGPQTGTAPVAAFGDSQGSELGYKTVGAAAVVPIHGTIVPRAVNLFDQYSGGTSAEQIGKAVDAAALDPKVDGIVLDIDSPGGAVFGIPESAAKIQAARKVKPITAVANHMAASAAYWYGTQASNLAVTPAGWVGSVGVIWARHDTTKAEEMAGVTTHLISAGEYKTEGYGPMTDAEATDMQAMVDAYYAQFISAVAKGRGVSPAKVEKDFGQGRVKLPADAIAARMADRVATLEQVINEVNGTRTERTRRRVAADMAAAGLPTP